MTEQPAAGRYEGVPDATYHGWEALNSSRIGLILRSPAHFKAAEEYPEEPTPQMIYGRAIHLAVLQPDKLLDHFCEPKPEKPSGKAYDRRTVKGKENYARWETAVLDPWLVSNNTKISLTQGEWDHLPGIAQSVDRTPEAHYVLGLGKHESSFVWQDPTTGLWCRCRPDATGESRNLLADLKSTVDARPEAFSKSIARFGYHRQAAWYRMGVNAVLGEGTIRDFVFVAVEKLPPYGVGTYVMDPADIARGEAENARALKQLRWCVDNGKWPGYGNRITPIGLPRYARHALDAREGLE